MIFSEVRPNVHANSEKKWKDDPEGWMWRWEASKGHLSVTLQRSKSIAVAGQVFVLRLKTEYGFLFSHEIKSTSESICYRMHFQFLISLDF